MEYGEGTTAASSYHARDMSVSSPYRILPEDNTHIFIVVL